MRARLGRMGHASRAKSSRALGSLTLAAASGVLLTAPAASLAQSAVAPTVGVAFSCTSVTYRFAGFPAKNGNIVSEVVLVDGSVATTSSSSFNGPEGSGTLAVAVPPGHHELDARAKWSTNGVRGESNQPLTGGISCAAAPNFAIEKQQRIGSTKRFTTEELKGEVGQTVEYQAVVTNSGNVALTFSGFTDERCDAGTISGGPGNRPVRPGESTTYLCHHLLSEADLLRDSYSNLASDTGTPPAGEGSLTRSSNAVVVRLRPPISAHGLAVRATEGQQLTAAVATFTDPEASASASEYAASVDWGDGSAPTSGAISGSGGVFSVTAPHTYADEGAGEVTVRISDLDNEANGATTSSRASVDDAALTATGVAATSTLAFSGTVATFSDLNTGAPTSDFSATVEWGDGASTGGTISGGGGSYAVSASHGYGAADTYKVKVRISDVGGAHASATGSISATAPPVGSPPGGTGAGGLLPLVVGSAPSSAVLPFRTGASAPIGPIFARLVKLTPVAGLVSVRTPSASSFVPLRSTRIVPVGTVLDTTHGRVLLTSAADTSSDRLQSGVFYGAVIRVSQLALRLGHRTVAATVLEFARARGSSCQAPARRTHPRTVRLWADVRGYYRVGGRYADGTALGDARWLTEDSCDRSLVHVTRGSVRVRDLIHRGVVSLRAPHSYQAHPR